MVDMIDPQIGESILDPACGTGGFLTCALDNLSIKEGFDQSSLIIQNSIRGIEKKPLPHLLCTTNLILHGIEKPATTKGNLLTKQFDSWKGLNQVNIVLSNPPFGGQEEDNTEKNFPEEFRTKETADLFLALIVKILKKNGRASVVLPDSSLFGEGVKAKIKEELIAKCNLHTIIRLPNGVFNPYTSIKTNLLFFEKGKKTKEIWYYEMPNPEGIKNFSRSRPIDIKHFNDIKKWWIERKENNYAWKVSLNEIKQRNFNLDIKNPHASKEQASYSTEELLFKIDMSFQKSANLLAEIKKALL